MKVGEMFLKKGLDRFARWRCQYVSMET